MFDIYYFLGKLTGILIVMYFARLFIYRPIRNIFRMVLGKGTGRIEKKELLKNED